MAAEGISAINSIVPLGESPTPTGLYVCLELTWLFKIAKICPSSARAESFAV